MFKLMYQSNHYMLTLTDFHCPFLIAPSVLSNVDSDTNVG